MTDEEVQPTPETPSSEQDNEYYGFALEDRADSRRARYAVVGAVVFHAVLFLAPLGFLRPAVAIAEPEPKPVFAVQEVRFKPPPPQTQRELPQPRTRRVPIPDPTPHEPEPLRLEEEIQQEIDMPDIDIVSGIPDAPPPIESEGPIPFGGNITRPVKISGPTPRYTEIGRRAGIQGVVIVEAIIDKAGAVTHVRVLKPLPMGLDQAAVEAVGTWRFEPATLNGRPVEVYYNLTINFRLQR